MHRGHPPQTAFPYRQPQPGVHEQDPISALAPFHARRADHERCPSPHPDAAAARSSRPCPTPPSRTRAQASSRATDTRTRARARRRRRRRRSLTCSQTGMQPTSRLQTDMQAQAQAPTAGRSRMGTTFSRVWCAGVRCVARGRVGGGTAKRQADKRGGFAGAGCRSRARDTHRISRPASD